MTCIVCADHFSWSVMEKITPHVHLVLESDIFGKHPPCGVALNADIDGQAETFLCLRCAARVGDAAKKALRALGVSA